MTTHYIPAILNWVNFKEEYMVKVQRYLDSYEVYSQHSFGQIIYNVFYGTNSFNLAQKLAHELNG